MGDFGAPQVSAPTELDGKPGPEIGQRVSGHDRSNGGNPEDQVVVLSARVCVNAEWPRPRTVELSLALARPEPSEIITLHPAHPVGIDAELLDPVLPRIYGGCVDWKPEQARVAFVPGRCQEHSGRAFAEAIRHREWVEKE